MLLAAFAVAVAYWPDFYYPGEAARWIALSLLVPMALASLPRPPRTALWWLGGAFLGWAALTLAWTVSPTSTVHALWKLALFAAAVLAGASLSERGLRVTLLAFAVGMAINGVLAAFQAGGLNPSLGGNPIVQVASPAGLFVNGNAMAQAGLLATIIVLRYRVWWLLPFCLAATFLPLFKGVIMAAFVAAAVVLLRKRWAACALAGAAVSVALGKWYLSAGSQAVDGRLTVWIDTIAGLRWFGHGGGAFDAAYPAFANLSAPRFFSFNQLPGTPHGDVLLMLNDYGIGAVLLFVFVVIVWWKARHEPVCAPVVAAFLAMGLVDFPFQQAAPGFVASLCLGGLLRAGVGLRDSGVGGGDALHRGYERPRADSGDVRGAARGRSVSVRAAHSHGGGDHAGARRLAAASSGTGGAPAGAARLSVRPET